MAVVVDVDVNVDPQEHHVIALPIGYFPSEKGKEDCFVMFSSFSNQNKRILPLVSHTSCEKGNRREKSRV